MGPAQILGAAVTATGLLILAFAARRARALRERELIPVTVVRAANGIDTNNVALTPDNPEPGPQLQLTLAPLDPPVEVNIGDRLRVFRHEEIPSQAWLHRTTDWIPVRSHSCAGLLIVLMGGVLASSANPTWSQDIPVAVLASLLVWLGCYATGSAIATMRDLRSSFRVTGVVRDRHELFTGRKTTYLPLVEYGPPDEPRRVWGIPRWCKPRIGARVALRLSGRPPHEAMRTTPLALIGIALMLTMGLFGLMALIGFTVS